MCGNVEAKAAARNVATIHSRLRHFSPTGLCESSRQPSSASGTRSRDGGQPEQLHRQVGENRAGKAKQVMDRLLRGVTERWILHRPGGKRDGTEQRKRDQRETGKLAQAPPDDVAEMLRDESDDVEAAICCPHALAFVCA